VSNVNELITPVLYACHQAEKIDKKMVETLDSAEKDWGLVEGQSGCQVILAVSMAVCRAGVASMHVPLYNIANLAGKPMDKYVLPAPPLIVTNGGGHAGNCLASGATQRLGGTSAHWVPLTNARTELLIPLKMIQQEICW